MGGLRPALNKTALPREVPRVFDLPEFASFLSGLRNVFSQATKKRRSPLLLMA